MFTLIPDSDPVLHQKTDEYDFTKAPSDLGELVENMLVFMRDSNGIGLAAPQIGLPMRLFVMDVVAEDGSVTSRACFNPEIVSVSEETEKKDEGCLSYPDLFIPISRPFTVEARYRDLQGNLVNEKFESWAARCYLHELDHLNGVTFDRVVSGFVLERARSKRKKILKKVFR